MRLLKFFSVIVLFCALCACDKSGSDYFFERPAAFTTVGSTICRNGNSSYATFVVDNTKKYGARIKKISGCMQKIDKKLKDKRDKKKGVYVGGTGVSIAHIIVDGEAVTATASTCQVTADHWKDNEKEAMRLAPHKGRIVFRKFNNEIEHEKDFNRSFLLDFYPEKVKSFNKEGFFFSGSDFEKFYIGFVDLEGQGDTAEVDFPVSEIAVIGEYIYLFDEFTGKIYKADKELSTEEAAVLDDYKEGKMVKIQGGRLAFFKDNRLGIFDYELNQLNTLETPEGFNISTVNAFYYGKDYKYRRFDDEKIAEKIQVFNKSLTDEEKDALSDANISVSSSWETVEATDHDIIWIGMENGYVRAYDFTASSWLVAPFDPKASSTYELEMRPYLSASHISYPKNSETTYENAPFIESVDVIRGLTSPVTYRFVYEGLSDDGTFEKGTYTVTRETFGEKVFAGTAKELKSGDSGETKSFEDDYISIVIRRSDDDFETEPETSFYISIRQSVPFVGFSSADILTEMQNPALLTFLGFSSLTRRFIEYDMYNDTVEQVYK